MALSTKGLQRKPEDLSETPRTLVKQLGVAWVYNPSAGEEETGGSLGWLASQPPYQPTSLPAW